MSQADEFEKLNDQLKTHGLTTTFLVLSTDNKTAKTKAINLWSKLCDKFKLLPNPYYGCEPHFILFAIFDTRYKSIQILDKFKNVLSRITTEYSAKLLTGEEFLKMCRERDKEEGK